MVLNYLCIKTLRKHGELLNGFGGVEYNLIEFRFHDFEVGFVRVRLIIRTNTNKVLVRSIMFVNVWLCSFVYVREQFVRLCSLTVRIYVLYIYIYNI